MTARGTISSKAQITIPKSIREAVGLRDGDEVVFIVKDSRDILLRKLDRGERGWLSLAEGSFSEWDNPEDGVYDRF